MLVTPPANSAVEQLDIRPCQVSNSHLSSFMDMPAERHFGPHVGGLAEEEGQLSFLEPSEEKPPLRKTRKWEEEEEEYGAHLTCSALWEEQ